MDEPMFIDMTPTWAGITPALLSSIIELGRKGSLTDQQRSALRGAKQELQKMACCADRLKEALRHLDIMCGAAEDMGFPTPTQLREAQEFLRAHDPEQYREKAS